METLALVYNSERFNMAEVMDNLRRHFDEIGERIFITSYEESHTDFTSAKEVIAIEEDEEGTHDNPHVFLRCLKRYNTDLEEPSLLVPHSVSLSDVSCFIAQKTKVFRLTPE